jgi:hypothetical protein
MNLRNSPLAVDLLIAAAVAAFVLLVTAGLAIAGFLGLLVLIACVISVVREARAARRRHRGSAHRHRAAR